MPTGFFKTYYYGDPIVFPASVMPCVSVELSRQDIKAGPTGMDEIDSTVYIKLIYNKRDDFGKGSHEVLGVRKLEEFASARDLTTNEYSPLSVMGILRKNFTLSTANNGYTVLDSTQSPVYNIVPRPNKTLTGECQIQCRFHQLIKVSTRL